jgi:hypothetical protein
MSKKNETPAEAVEEVTVTETETIDEKSTLEVLDEKLRDDEVLADLPELKEPIKLRIRERNILLELVMRADQMSKAEDADEVSTKMASLDLMAGIDEFAETIAVDKNAYIEWSEKQSYDAFLALLNRYSAALGK